MKKLMAVLLALLMCSATALATELPTLAPELLKTDAASYALLAETAGFVMPAGYQLEMYTRADLNGDGFEDAIAASLLADDGIHRMLVVFTADAFTHSIHTSETALPGNLAGGAMFRGFSIGDGFITIHTAQEWQTNVNVTYSFGLHGQSFYLDMVHVERWNPDSGEGTQEVFVLHSGVYQKMNGAMQDGTFVPITVTEENTFDPHHATILLEDFDIDAFPLDWDAFLAMIEGKKTDPKPSAKPRPTSSAMPGPVYPTDMPGPVYPTDMPGPVYPTDMPGPVYPTDMPGPVYPTDMPGPVYPTDMPGPINTPTPTPSPSPSPVPTDMPGPIDVDDAPADE